VSEAHILDEEFVYNIFSFFKELKIY
jgi:hypothetical protein